jgi:uncharacterized protein (DUF488 family)
MFVCWLTEQLYKNHYNISIQQRDYMHKLLHFDTYSTTSFLNKFVEYGINVYADGFINEHGKVFVRNGRLEKSVENS